MLETRAIPQPTYCANVHPMNSLEEWRRAVSTFAPALRQALGWERMPLGLWFNNSVLGEIGGDYASIRSWLERHQAYCFTLNAFPYIDFHAPRVKASVYRPDWRDPERLRYTLECAALLAELVDAPPGAGSLSTVPLGWGRGWGEADSLAAGRNLVACARGLRELEEKTGKRIRLCLEPEPGCVIEYTAGAVHFWNNYLRYLALEGGLVDEEMDRYLGLCYDTCHQAVQFEDPDVSLGQLRSAGIPVGKMQLSCALEFACDPRRKTLERRRDFVEPKFLHQTRQMAPNAPRAWDDLPQALEDPEADWGVDWRTHYHVPLDSGGELGQLGIATTFDHMKRAVELALEGNLCDHFEVETYTWTVLPEGMRPTDDEGLAAGLAREVKLAAALLRGEPRA